MNFNLVEDPWIPIVDYGLVSLKDVFQKKELILLSGNSVNKICVLKFLLAIAQVSYTPKDLKDWQNTGKDGIAAKALNYLNRNKELFYLYGDKPFLQMPKLKEIFIRKKLKPINISNFIFGISSGNNTLFTETEKEKLNLTDAQKTMILLNLLSFCFGGKGTVCNDVFLSSDYTDKKKSGKPGISLGSFGYLHNFIFGNSILETIYFNLVTQEDISNMKVFEQGLGTAPWEKMPETENCQMAQNLKKTYVGRLVPMSRYCCIENNIIYITEGIQYFSYKDGVCDLSMTMDKSSSKIKVKYADPQKKAWRDIAAILSFLDTDTRNIFECAQIKLGLEKTLSLNKNIEFSILSAGVKVNNNAGEQYISGLNDFVESRFMLNTKVLNIIGFQNFKIEMKILEDTSKYLYASIKKYFSGDGSQAKIATLDFWKALDNISQKIINVTFSKNYKNDIKKIRNNIKKIAHGIYDKYCPKDTANQIDNWSKNKPKFNNLFKVDAL